MIFYLLYVNLYEDLDIMKQIAYGVSDRLFLTCQDHHHKMLQVTGPEIFDTWYDEALHCGDFVSK